MGIIYKAENLVNGKIYVGKTANSIEHRMNSHLRRASKERVAKYSNSLRNSENPSVYKEGHVPWNLGVPMIHSPESNEQRSKTMKNKKKPPEVIENMRLAQQARLEINIKEDLNNGNNWRHHHHL